MTDLDRLIKAVERGEFPVNIDAMNEEKIFKDWDQCFTAGMAFNGSLDAAKALHDALLPETRYLVGGDNYDWPENTGAIVFATPKQVGIVAGNNPARAWLLAILKAYRSLQ